jgi:hypothetical protein
MPTTAWTTINAARISQKGAFGIRGERAAAAARPSVPE